MGWWLSPEPSKHTRLPTASLKRPTRLPRAPHAPPIRLPHAFNTHPKRILNTPREDDFWQADHEVMCVCNKCACVWHRHIYCICTYTHTAYTLAHTRTTHPQIAVAEGGGCCGLENLRTLCTPCHKKETDALRMRLKHTSRAAHAAGTRDIRNMLTRTHTHPHGKGNGDGNGGGNGGGYGGGYGGGDGSGDGDGVLSKSRSMSVSTCGSRPRLERSFTDLDTDTHPKRAKRAEKAASPEVEVESLVSVTPGMVSSTHNLDFSDD